MNISGNIVYDFIKRESKKIDNLDLIRGNPNLAIPYFTVDDIDPNVTIVNSQLHIDLQDHITKYKNSLIIIPRGHGKTTQTSARIAYEIGKNPNIRVKIFCESMKQAKERVGPIKQYIEMNENYQRLFPHIKPDKEKLWTANAFTVQRKSYAKDATVEAVGVYTAATGGRADLILADDICCEESLTSTSNREKVKQVFRNTIHNLLAVNGKIIYIATPFHYDDLTMELMRRAPMNGFELFFRAIDREYNPVWPEKFDKSWIISKYNSIEAGPFARGYHCEPMADEDATFNINKVRSSLIITEADPVEIEKAHNWTKVMSVDPALGETSRSDMTVILVLGIHPTQHYKVPLDIFCKRVDSPTTGAKIIEMQNKWHCAAIRVEKAAYQGSLEQWTKVLSSSKLPFSTLEGKLPEKHERLKALAVQVYNGQFKIYCHKHPIPESIIDMTYQEDEKSGANCECGYCSLVKQMAYHPVWKRDDVIDALHCASKLADEFITPRGGSFDVWRWGKGR